MRNNSSSSDHSDGSNPSQFESFVVPSSDRSNPVVSNVSNNVERVSVPDVQIESSPWNNAAELEAASEQRLRLLSRAVASASGGSIDSAMRSQSGVDAGALNSQSAPQATIPEIVQAAECGLPSGDVSAEVRPFWEEHEDGRTESRLSGIVDSILEYFPIQQPRAIVFAGMQNETALDEIAAEVAQLLARRRVGKILLVDANVGTAALSQSAGASESAGLLEAIENMEPWQAHLQTGASSGLEFLPLGRSRAGSLSTESIGNLLQTVRPHYQFTCFSVGDFDAGLAPMFANECDGSFLLVDMVKASKTVARKAVAQLKSATGEFLGCIALNE